MRTTIISHKQLRIIVILVEAYHIVYVEIKVQIEYRLHQSVCTLFILPLHESLAGPR
jgi:hypothetical protein